MACCEHDSPGGTVNQRGRGENLPDWWVPYWDGPEEDPMTPPGYYQLSEDRAQSSVSSHSVRKRKQEDDAESRVEPKARVDEAGPSGTKPQPMRMVGPSQIPVEDLPPKKRQRMIRKELHTYQTIFEELCSLRRQIDISQNQYGFIYMDYFYYVRLLHSDIVDQDEGEIDESMWGQALVDSLPGTPIWQEQVQLISDRSKQGVYDNFDQILDELELFVTSYFPLSPMP